MRNVVCHPGVLQCNDLRWQCVPLQWFLWLGINTNKGDEVEIRSHCAFKPWLKTSFTGDQLADGIEMGFRYMEMSLSEDSSVMLL